MLRRLVTFILFLPLVACWDNSGPREPRLFEVFLVVGGTGAAGVEGAGISKSTQARAWPALLTERLHLPPYIFAALNEPGCPAPYVAPFLRGSPVPCAGVEGGTPSNVIMLSSVAVPGARLADAFSYAGSTSEAMNLTMLGAHTQIEIMTQRDPTFVAIQFGDEELQSALKAGDITTIPSAAQFQADLDRTVSALNALHWLKGVLIVGTMDPLRLPLLQPGAYFFLARDPATGRFMGKPVNSNCSPVTPLGTPNPLSRNLISFSVVGNAPEINCDPAQFGGVLDQTEIVAINQRVNDFNNALAAMATQNNWAFVDVRSLLTPRMLEKNASGRYTQVRLCQDLPTATTAAQFQAAVLNSCPVTGPTAAANFFGALFSFDGQTLAPAGHALLADAAVAAIAQKYPGQ
ncbi:MAG TPA: hypothetical protein VFO52_08220 [Longimicrobiales bacterium]|nr:hypothetical protein [Longimicrobiales bacterium]